jgi:peptidoglycan/LPS O-acetylase OafA/YrhL
MRIPEIQALRALAALLVLFYHAHWIPGGFIGVDIFYVISGYLITALLLRECEKTGRISFRTFYLRRIKRLLPTSFVVLIVTALVVWLLYPAILRKDLGLDIAAASLYVSNYFFAFWQMDYQNLDAIPPVVIHYWSLAVEEQFYLFWPIVIYLLYKIGGRRGVAVGASTISVLSFSLGLYLTNTSPVFAFYSLPSRAWELSVGALILFIPSRIKFSTRYAWVALILIIYATLRFDESTRFPGTAALLPVLGTAVALATVKSWPAAIRSISHLRTVQWLGDISYPLYLWHWPVLIIPSVHFGRELSLTERLCAISLTLLLAGATHRFIEDPFRRTDFPAKKIVIGAIAASLLSLLAALLIIVSSTERITLKGGETFNLASVRAEPRTYQDGCHLRNGRITPPECLYGDKSSTRKIVLFGDSHAAQWFPALERLANQNQFGLISLTKSACPGPAVRKIDFAQYTNAECAAWRERVYQLIAQIKPAAIIVAGMQYFKIPDEYSSRAQWWQEGQQETLNKLRPHSSKIVSLSDTPRPRRDIPTCLSSTRNDQCNDTAKSEAIFSPGYLRINPTSWLCTAKSCPALVNGVVAYRDASHISVAMSESLSQQLGEALRSQGIALK